MFNKSYQLLPQRDPSSSPRTPGLFVETGGFSQPGYHGGLSFDNMPNVSKSDFTGRSATQLLTHWLQRVTAESKIIKNKYS